MRTSWLWIVTIALFHTAGCKSDQLDDGRVPSGAGVTAAVGTGTSASSATKAVGSGAVSSSSGATSGGMADCNNMMLDGDETDVDCGGSCDTLCAVGKKCKNGDDCVEQVCDQSKCVPPTCTDEVENGDEVDVDCGGTCAERCGTGKKCNEDTDCLDKKCDMGNHTCLAPSCSDVIQNGHESDIDCGGDLCAGCRPGQTCDTPADCATGSCVASQCECPMGMETVTVNGAGAYCMDRVEVTYGDYENFVLANFPFEAPDMPAECKAGANTSWIPEGPWPGSPQGGAQHFVLRPVRYVDYCDAAGYCLWKGRRLCGGILGGPSAPAEFTNPSTDQWFNACSAQGANDYPYGDAYNSSLCVAGSPGTFPATSTPNCIGGFPELFNMSGNVAEWTDSCQASGVTRTCRVRGGSYLAQSTDVACAADRFEPYLDHPIDVGIRCCLP